MKMKLLYALLFVMLLCPFTSIAGDIYSFEAASVPSEFSVTDGTLSVSASKYKLGKNSLSWQWNANSVLSVNNPANLATACKNNNGGITVWIYNEKESNESLKFAFFDAANEECSINFKLNFKGWRCLWATFRYDMRFYNASATLNNMKVIAPPSANGRFYIDFLEFTNNVSWERISDAQYKLNQTNHNIISYLDIRNTLVPTPVVPTSEQRNAFSTIAKRLDEWYLGTGKHAANEIYKKREKALNSYINSAKNKIANLNLIKEEDGTVTGEGLFPVTYQGATVDGVSVNTFRNVSEAYLIQLAYDYRRTKNATSLEAVQNIFDWYCNQGWADGSGLGSLRFEMLRSAGFYHSAYLMKDDLGDERFNNVMDATRWHSMFGTAYTTPETPGELSDYIRTLAIPKLAYALTIKDEAERNVAMQAYREYTKNALAKAPGFKGTFKPDYSGYHHNGVYYSAYYPDALYAGCLVYYLLHDTPYTLGDDMYNELKQALLTFRFFCGELNVPAATTGRFPAQQTILHQLLPAFAYLGLSAETTDVELTGAFKRLWKPNENPMLAYIQKARTDICFSTTLGEVEMLLDFDAENGVAEANPTGTLYMPYSGLLIARQPKWMITAKGMSKYIWDYESSGSENIYGRYLSYGQLEFTDLENKNSSYNPTNPDWSWNHIPGGTSKFLSYINLDYNKTNGKHRNLSDKTFLGGIALNDNTAMFTNQVHDNAIDKSFYADKSTFVFGNLVYCIGSGINSNSTTTPVYTTLFQNVLSTEFGKVYINGEEYSSDINNVANPIIKDNYGNAFIVQDGSVNIKKNASCMLAYIDHGKIISDKKYNYAWLIKPTDEQIENHKNDMPLTVLSQDEKAHAVYHKEEKILALSVFKSDAPLDIRQVYSLSKPMMLMLAENADNSLSLAFSDPDMKRDSAPRGDDLTPSVASQKGEATEVTIVLNGVYKKIDGDVNVSIDVQGDKTVVSYPFAKEGETYRLKLTEIESSIEGSKQDSNVFSVRAGSKYITINSQSNELFDFRIFDLMGRLLYAECNNSQSAIIDRNVLPSGVLVVKINNNSINKDFKFINNN